MMKRRAFLMGSAAAVGATALAGCNNSAAPTLEGPVTLSFSTWAFQEPTVKAVEKVVADWNAANPDITVELRKVAPDAVHDTLVTQFNGNAAPDIIHNESADLAGFSKQGFLADLTELIPAEVKSAVPEAVWGTCTFGGKITGVPTIAQMYIPYVNLTMLEAAGVKPAAVGSEWSWDDFSAHAAKLTKEGQAGFAWGMKQSTAGILSLSMSYDGVWFTGDEGKPSIQIGDNELQVVRHVKAMLEAKSMTDTSITLGGADVVPGFIGGKYAMIMAANYLATDIAEKAPDTFKWAMMPPLKGTSTHQVANPQTLSIARQSKNPEQAMKFITYFMQATNLAAFGAGDALVPVTADAAAKVKETKAGANGWDNVLDSATTSLVSAPLIKAEKYSQWKSEVGNPAFQEFFTGRIDEAGLVGKLTDGWNKANA